MTDQQSPEPCTRCGADVLPVLSGPPGDRDVWHRYRILLIRREAAAAVTLRFRMFTRRWLPEHAGDQLRETFTELTLCDPCARDVLLFAQGKEPS